MKTEKILDYLCCPYCQEKKLRMQNKDIFCPRCRIVYKIIEGIPVLMEESCLGEQEKGQVKWFDDHYSRFSHQEYRLENWRQSMLKRVLETDFANQVKTYLDLGCGATGYTVIEAARRKDWLSFGIDISLEAMVKARTLAEKQNLGRKTAFLVCSAESLPFRKNLFDYVSALGVLEHLQNDEVVIDAVARILKKKGRFYVCTPNTYKKMWPFLWPIYYFLDKKIGHKRHYSIKGLVQKMKASGFEPEKAFYNAHLIKLLGLVLEKMNLLSDDKWWQLEQKDINQDPMGIQLNAVFQKT